MKITGTVIEIGEIQKGTSKKGKEWASQSVVIKFMDGDYEKALSVQFFKVEKLEGIKLDAVVDINFSLESKKYNDKWFTNVNGYGINRVTGITEEVETAKSDENDLPF